jgi:hypothetical protein
MTKLTRPVRREVVSGRYGPMIVTLTPLTIEIREKGRRTSFSLPYGCAYQHAVMLTVTDKKARRRQLRAKRGLLRRGA